MRDPSADVLAQLLAFIYDPSAARRLSGRLRPRVVGRPHPLRRLPRLRRPGVVHALSPQRFCCHPWANQWPLPVMQKPPPPPPPPIGDSQPEDLAAIQRQRILSGGKKITTGDLAQLTASGFRILLFLALSFVAIMVTVFFPPLGILLLFLLAVVALTAR